MTHPRPFSRALTAAAALALAISLSAHAQTAAVDDDDDAAAAPNSQVLPNTGQVLTPLAPNKARFEPLNPNLPDAPEYLAGQAVTSITSPDHKTLLILTSGYNLYNYTSGTNLGAQNNADSNEYVFIYDITSQLPVKKQVIQVPNTYAGIVFDPSGTAFYVSGGVNDNVHLYSLGANGQWSEQAQSPIALGHKTGNGLGVSPEAAGIAITPDGLKLVVANYYNDSISILTNTKGAWAKTGELDLRPGKTNAAKAGVPGGEYPLWVCMAGETAFISSVRDREVVVVANIASVPSVKTRIKLKGQPNKMTINPEGTRLYVAEDETDSVAVIDSQYPQLLGTIPVGTPTDLLPADRKNFTGSNTNSVTLSADEKTLYVTNGNTNNVAVVSLNYVTSNSYVAGLIPTGWYPNSLSLSADGKYMYVVNGKSPTGPNPGNCKGLTSALAAQCQASNQYSLQLVKAGFQSFPTPTPSELNKLTELVADNNHFSRIVPSADMAKMAFLHNQIQHVIYIIKENRTYDQILGDLPQGNGDPDLTEFGQAITPNLHSIASNFVTLDSFYDSSEVSMDGWPWSTSARAPDVVEKQVTVNYAGRGVSYDSEGTNRNINVANATPAARIAADPFNPADPDLLPGTVDTAAPDSPTGKINQGYIWDAALKAGLSVRNYGFLVDLTRSALPPPYNIPETALLPYNTKTQVAYPANVALAPFTDIYFRGFDQSFPDYYRFQEWKREFDGYNMSGNLPALSLVRLAHDHTGNYSSAVAGINTPELEVADNDYAVGLVAQSVANSNYKSNTLIFVIEDDAQDGADHVDAHRSTAYIIGPYVKQHAVISKPYNTVNMVRTMEDILGIGQLNLNDSVAVPMAEVFDINQPKWTFAAAPSAYLYGTQLPLPAQTSSLVTIPRSTHDGSYWSLVTKGLDFSVEDRLNGADYNRILWKGLKGNEPYPQGPTGLDLSMHRTDLLLHAKTLHGSEQQPVASNLDRTGGQ